MNTLLVNSLHWIKHVGFIFHSRSVVNDVKPTSTCTATCIRNSSLLNRLGGQGWHRSGGRKQEWSSSGVEEGKRNWERQRTVTQTRQPNSISNDCQLHHDYRWGLGNTIPVPRMPCDCSLYRQPLRNSDASLCASGARCQQQMLAKRWDISLNVIWKWTL